MDDNDFTRTKEFTWTGQVLRLFHNSLTKTIQSWDNFEANELQYFHTGDTGAIQTSWELCFASMKKDVAELKFLQLCLQQRIEMFDTMRNSVSSKIIFDPSGGLMRDAFSLSMRPP